MPRPMPRVPPVTSATRAFEVSGVNRFRSRPGSEDPALQVRQGLKALPYRSSALDLPMLRGRA
jgi:hypothetical protein